MNKAVLLERFEKWEIEHKAEINQREQCARDQLKGFLSRYGTKELLRAMDLMDFAFQKGGRKDSLCYMIDFGTDALGINRADVQSGYQRYGIQLKENGRDWYPFCKEKNNKSRYGNNPIEVYEAFKTRTIELLAATQTGADETIEKIDLPQLHKNKLHFIYSDWNSLPIYVQPHLDRILSWLGMPARRGESTFQKRKRIYDCLKKDFGTRMTPWRFMDFVYNDRIMKALINGRRPEITKRVFQGFLRNVPVDLSIDVSEPKTSNDERNAVGKTGEKIALMYLETHRSELCIKEGSPILRICDDPMPGIHCDLAYTRVSNGVEEPVYIEVKATSKKDKNVFQFQMSAYEKEFMERHWNNYSIYYIADVYNAYEIIELLPKEIVAMLQPASFFVDARI